jgi:hypothetical protein
MLTVSIASVAGLFAMLSRFNSPKSPARWGRFFSDCAGTDTDPKYCSATNAGGGHAALAKT